MHINTTKFMDFYNSDYMQTLRQHQELGTMSDTVLRTCKSCIRNERVSGKSRRTDLIAKPYDLDVIENIKVKHIGNLCNLKCVMCFPEVSSLFAQEAGQLGEYDGDIVIKHDPTETYLAGLAEVLPRVKEIRLIGGEPVINPMTWQFVGWLKDNNFSHLKLHFTTNGTRTFTKQQKELLSFFSDVDIIFSIDAIGKKNDYIRYPSKFSELEKNLKDTKSFVSHVNIHSCVTMLSIGYLEEVVEYFWDTDVVVGDGITKPEFLSPEIMPYSIKEQYTSSIPHIKKILEAKPDYSKFMEGMIFLKKRDQYRGNNLLDMWPEFKDYYPIGTT